MYVHCALYVCIVKCINQENTYTSKPVQQQDHINQALNKQYNMYAY